MKPRVRICPSDPWEFLISVDFAFDNTYVVAGSADVPQGHRINAVNQLLDARVRRQLDSGLFLTCQLSRTSGYNLSKVIT